MTLPIARDLDERGHSHQHNPAGNTPLMARRRRQVKDALAARFRSPSVGPSARIRSAGCHDDDRVVNGEDADGAIRMAPRQFARRPLGTASIER
jgi:hypothetical protein